MYYDFEIQRLIEWKKNQPFGWFFIRKVARFFNNIHLSFISRFIWRQQLMACDYCGRLVGMNSTISRFGFTCEDIIT